jgi:CDI immunity proteins
MSDFQILTMRSLEKQPSGDGGSSALDEWYRSIRDIPLDDLPIGDVARSLRQSLFPDFVVPVAIRHLRENPLAGDFYDGELLASLRNVGRDFWRRREELRSQLAGLLAKIDTCELDVDAASDINAIRRDAEIR